MRYEYIMESLMIYQFYFIIDMMTIVIITRQQAQDQILPLHSSKSIAKTPSKRDWMFSDLRFHAPVPCLLQGMLGSSSSTISPAASSIWNPNPVSGTFLWVQSKRDRLLFALPRSLDICKRVPPTGDQLPAVCYPTATHEIIHIDPFRLSATLNPHKANCT